MCVCVCVLLRVVCCKSHKFKSFTPSYKIIWSIGLSVYSTLFNHWSIGPSVYRDSPDFDMYKRLSTFESLTQARLSVFETWLRFLSNGASIPSFSITTLFTLDDGQTGTRPILDRPSSGWWCDPRSLWSAPSASQGSCLPQSQPAGEIK